MLIGSLAISMTANTTKLAAGLAQAQGRVSGFVAATASSGARIVGSLAKMSAVGGAAFGAMAVKSAASAAHLTEAINKTDQVFGSSAEHVKSSAEKMRDAYGTATQAYLDGTAALGGQLQGVGYAESDAAGLSVQLANLAADAAAFRDVGFDDALTKIRAGLSGESEPLKAWGVMIDENAVKTEALAMGLIKAGGEMDNSAKVQARLSLITKGLAKDSGALSRESTGTAAQMAEFWGRLETLWETIGKTFEESVGGALQYVNQGVVAAGLAWTDATAAFSSWFGTTAQGLEVADGGVGILRQSIEWIGDAWGVVKSVALSVFGYMESGLATVTNWVAKLLDGLAHLGAGDWASNAASALRDYSHAASKIAADSHAASQAAWEGVGRESPMLKYWEEAGKTIAAAKAELASPVAVGTGIGGPRKTETPTTKAAKDPGFAGAMARGSAEATQAVLRHRYGGAKDPNAAKTATATTKTAAGVEELKTIGRETVAAIQAAAGSPVPVFSI